MALEKGTEEFEMFGDFFKICKRYWDIQDTDKYWDDLVKETDIFCKKYETEILSQKLMFSFLETQEIKNRIINKNRR